MADLEQALQEEMGMCGWWTALGVSRPVARPQTGDEGGPTPYSEYSLHFKTTAVPRGGGLVTMPEVPGSEMGRPKESQPHVCGSRFSQFSLIFALDDGHCSG